MERMEEGVFMVVTLNKKEKRWGKGGGVALLVLAASQREIHVAKKIGYPFRIFC